MSNIELNTIDNELNYQEQDKEFYVNLSLDPRTVFPDFQVISPISNSSVCPLASELLTVGLVIDGVFPAVGLVIEDTVSLLIEIVLSSSNVYDATNLFSFLWLESIVAGFPLIVTIESEENL